MTGRARAWAAGAAIGVGASVLMCGLAAVTVVLVPTWWPHPAVGALSGLVLLGTGAALVSVGFIHLGSWQFGAAAVVELLLAFTALALMDQAVLDLWGKRVETVVTDVVRHERNAPTGKVTRSWYACSLKRLDGTALERDLRESEFFPLGRACPADAEVGDRITVYAVSGGFAPPQTNAPVASAWFLASFTTAAAAAAGFTAVGMTREGAPGSGRPSRVVHKHPSEKPGRK